MAIVAAFTGRGNHAPPGRALQFGASLVSYRGRIRSRVFSGGLDEDVDPVLVAALEWATKIAAACRCPQEVSAFQFDPLV